MAQCPFLGKPQLRAPLPPPAVLREVILGGKLEQERPLPFKGEVDTSPYFLCLLTALLEAALHWIMVESDPYEALFALEAVSVPYKFSSKE